MTRFLVPTAVGRPASCSRLRRCAGTLAVAGAARRGHAGPRARTPIRCVAKVNGAEIAESDLAIGRRGAGRAASPQMDPGDQEGDVLSFLIDMKIVAKAAEAKKLGDTPDFKQELAFARNQAADGQLLAERGQGSRHRRRP